MTDKPLKVFKTDFLGIMAVEVKDLKARLLQLKKDARHEIAFVCSDNIQKRDENLQ